MFKPFASIVKHDNPPATDDLSLFVDENAPAGINCYKYLLYKLGIDVEHETLVGGLPGCLFREVGTIDEADAIGVTFKPKTPGVYFQIPHVIYVDHTRGDRLFHVSNVGSRPAEVLRDDLPVLYPPQDKQLVYLKLKPEAQTIAGRAKLLSIAIRTNTWNGTISKYP